MRRLPLLLVAVALFLPSSDGQAGLASTSVEISVTVVGDATFYFEDGQVVGVQSALPTEEVAGLVLDLIPHMDDSGALAFYTVSPITLAAAEELLAVGKIKRMEEDAFLAAREEERKKADRVGSAGDAP